MGGPGCNCGSKGGATSRGGYPPSLRGCGCGPGSPVAYVDTVARETHGVGMFGDPPPGTMVELVNGARTVADLAAVITRALAHADTVAHDITNTYVGGKHQNEAHWAAEKLKYAQAIQAVRASLIGAAQDARTLSPDAPIPPRFAAIVRKVGGYAVPTPIGLAPWVLEAQFYAMARDAEKDLGGNMPKIPGLPQYDDQWMIIVLVVLAAFVLGKVRF